MSTDIPISPDALRADIAKTRAQLGETASALAAKADVKARAKGSARRTRERVGQKATETVRRQVENTDVTEVVRRPLPMTIVAAAVAAAVVVTILVRRKRR